MSERIAPPAAAMTSDAAQAFQTTRGTPPFGPFRTLLAAPHLLDRVEALGRRVRYEGTLSDDVRELVILTTATYYRQPVEWAIHAPIALQAGCAQATLDAIQANREPGAPPAQRLAWAVARALHEQQDLDDALFTAAQAQFGDAGLLELAVLTGYYSLLAMVMNTARTAH